jgi:hypothetical protein
VISDGGFLAVVTVVAPSGPHGIPCGTDGPISWRILVASIDKDGKPAALAEFATGRSTLQVSTPDFEGGLVSSCDYANWPNVSLSNGLIAYNVEHATAAHPFGSEILLRSLADGSTVRDLLTPEYVDSLKLSGKNLVWMEYGGTTATRLPLRISTAANPTAKDLLVYETPGDVGDYWSVPNYILAGNWLAWEGFSAGKIWLRDLTTGKISQISRAGAVCQLGDFDGKEAVMGCGSDPTALTWSDSFQADWLVFWSRSAGYRLLAGTPSSPEPYLCGLSSGSLSVTFASSSPDGTPNDTVWTIPIAALTGS